MVWGVAQQQGRVDAVGSGSSGREGCLEQLTDVLILSLYFMQRSRVCGKREVDSQELLPYTRVRQATAQACVKLSIKSYH